jgi:hypothetical protein
VRPALHGSWEALFHSILAARFLLTWGANSAVSDAFRDPQLERTGNRVIYQSRNRAD